MEYTDAPATGTEAVFQNVTRSDLEQHELAAREGQLVPGETAEGKASDAMAVLLSIVPGLGHIYKGHRFVGILLIIGAPFAVALSALAATATAGFGLGLMVLYWFAVMFHAYAITDRITPNIRDVGEEY